jgi:hypothetical protein
VSNVHYSFNIGDYQSTQRTFPKGRPCVPPLIDWYYLDEKPMTDRNPSGYASVKDCGSER